MWAKDSSMVADKFPFFLSSHRFPSSMSPSQSQAMLLLSFVLTIPLTLIVGIDWKRVWEGDEGKTKKLQRQGFYEGVQSEEVAMREEERKGTGRGCRGEKCGKTEKERGSRERTFPGNYIVCKRTHKIVVEEHDDKEMKWTTTESWRGVTDFPLLLVLLLSSSVSVAFLLMFISSL